MKKHLQLITGFILFGSLFLHSQDNFQRIYSAWGDKVVEWVIPSNDGGLILAGNIGSFEASGDGLIIKTDTAGNIIWSKTLGGPGGDMLVKIISCFDGGYVAIGNSNSFGQGEPDAWVTRINEDGEVLWSDCLGTLFKDEARGIIQTKEGGFLVVGQNNVYEAASFFALNSNGGLLWIKEFSQGETIWFNDILETNISVYYLTGVLNYDGFGNVDCFILETNSTGDIIRCKVYGGQDNDSFRTLIPYQDSFLVVGDTWSWQNHHLGYLAKLTPDLVIEKAIVLGDNNVNQYLESVCIFPNSIYAPVKLTNGSAYIIELSPDLTLKNSWQFNPDVYSYSSHIISLGDSLIAFSGSCTADQTLRKDVYLTMFHPDDTTYDCNTIPHSTFLSNVEMQSGNLDLSEVNTGAIFQHLDIESIDILLESNRLCLPLPIADFQSPDQACANVPVSIINQSQKSDAYKWYFEGAIPATSDSTDPGTIIYENPGIYSIKLVAINEGGNDSIVKNIKIYPDIGFSLGPDTTILLSNTLQFITIGEYDSYLWSTGDTTSYLMLPATELQTGNNLVWLEIHNGPCFASDSVNINVVDNSAINENIHPEILVYPNPVKKSGQIALKSAEVPVSVTFYNQLGAEVSRIYPSDNRIEIEDLEPGVYMVEMTFRDFILKRRLIILN